jgi:hypothetical protein
LRGGLEHLKIETRLIGERFEIVMGECDLEAIGVPSFILVRREKWREEGKSCRVEGEKL